MVVSNKINENDSEEGLKLAHKLVKGVTEDVEKLLFNTAISKMMEFLNEFTKLSTYPKSAVKIAVQILAPFAPHLAEELWEYLGEKPSVVHAPWPTYNPAYLVEERATFVIQVNGKVRGTYQLAIETIFVPQKLLNIVVGK
jgi:leucyl-tRNA synthetase